MFGKFATGVCVLLVEKGNSCVKGLTINSFSSISLDPALISFSLKTDSKFCAEFDKKKSFSINVLSEEQKFLAQNCCISGGSSFSVESVVKTDLSYYIPGSLVSIFCNLQTTFEGGDHTIFLCSVLDMLHHDDVEPLVFFDSKYCSLFK